MSRISELAARVSRQATGSEDDFQKALVESVGEVNKFLSEDTTDCPDCPPNPNNEATAEEDKAWKDAFKLKSFAGKATQHHIKAMSHHIKRGKRKNGDPISQADAEKTAQVLVDTARSQSQQDTCDDLLESRKNFRQSEVSTISQENQEEEGEVN